MPDVSMMCPPATLIKLTFSVFYVSINVSTGAGAPWGWVGIYIVVEYFEKFLKRQLAPWLKYIKPILTISSVFKIVIGN